MEVLDQVDREVMQLLLQGDDLVLNSLRQQFSGLESSSRELTGAGYYTKFSFPADTNRLKGSPTFCFGDVSVKSENLSRGLGYLLFITNGMIDVLEAYTYDERFSGEVSNPVVQYTNESRDLQQLIQLKKQ